MQTGLYFIQNDKHQLYFFHTLKTAQQARQVLGETWSEPNRCKATKDTAFAAEGWAVIDDIKFRSSCKVICVTASWENALKMLEEKKVTMSEAYITAAVPIFSESLWRLYANELSQQRLQQTVESINALLKNLPPADRPQALSQAMKLITKNK